MSSVPEWTRGYRRIAIAGHYPKGTSTVALCAIAFFYQSIPKANLMIIRQMIPQRTVRKMFLNLVATITVGTAASR